VGLPPPDAVSEVELPEQIATLVGVTVTVALAVEIPVISVLMADILVVVRVWVTVLVTPNFTHGKAAGYWPAEILASVPVTSPVT
jgi:hypothetical protein